MDSDTLVSIITAALGGFCIVFGLYSLVIKEKLYISEAVVATLCGLLIRIIATNDSTPLWENQNDLNRQFSRIVIAIQVMATGVALPKKYLWKEWKSLMTLLIPVMSWMWLISGACVWWLLPDLKFLEALMIASCFTPTDPVLANSIVQGHFAEKYVPQHIRHLIAAESGANDGLGFPFLFLAIYLIQFSTGDALAVWGYKVMFYEIAVSIACGAIVGYLGRKLLRFSHEKKLVDEESFALYPVILALFLVGTLGLLGSDDLLACFIAGNSFTWDGWYHVETKNAAEIMKSIEMLLNLSIFMYIGFIMPWSSWVEIGFSRLLLMAILVHLFRRLPVIVLLYKKFIPSIRSISEAVFTGWFGPMGVGSMFYCAVAVEIIQNNIDNAIFSNQVAKYTEPIVYFIVLTSIIFHGLSIPIYQAVKYIPKYCFGYKQYEAIIEQHPSSSDLERAPVSVNIIIWLIKMILYIIDFYTDYISFTFVLWYAIDQPST
ncbi:Cation/H+ exchanger [Phascolomyces articulosus]|uniref:Cation/H+ exchanger n=1 Tax=Phascolomyces articulosus TaxID=60185 RepID=A0AAD5P7M4_9FUNG|nr:Cation/H+ exchanger [Phascolomyces articulosus]